MAHKRIGKHANVLGRDNKQTDFQHVLRPDTEISLVVAGRDGSEAAEDSRIDTNTADAVGAHKLFGFYITLSQDSFGGDIGKARVVNACNPAMTC